MGLEIKKSESKNFNEQTISRRAFLGGAIASFAGAFFSGCCAFKNSSSSNNTDQNQQIANQQRAKMGENITQEDLDKINSTNSEWQKQKDQELEEERKKQKIYSKQQNIQQPTTTDQTKDKESSKKQKVNGFGWNYTEKK